MKPQVLVAAPSAAARHLSGALTARFAVVVATDPRKAAVLAIMASVQAMVVWDGFAPHLRSRHGVRVITVVPGEDLDELPARVAAAIPVRKHTERTRSAGLATLASLPYEEFLELARFWTTRDYLLGLMRTHGGNVSEAARAAEIERESLHRLLRRHELEAEMFRAHEPGDAAPLAKIRTTCAARRAGILQHKGA